MERPLIMLTIKAVIAALFSIAVAPALGFLPLWGLWNWLVPSIFGLGGISLLESFGLIALVGCLLFPVTLSQS